MIAAYALPAVAVWAALGFLVTTVRLAGFGLAAAAVYGGYYGATEVSGRRGLPPPGRSWQVPQTMLIEAPVRRRVLVWGALLGPGFATRNPYAGFGLLPLALASMPGTGAGLAVGAAIGLAHGTARAAALLRDVRDLGPVEASPAPASPVAASPVAASPVLAIPARAGPAGADPAGAGLAGDAPGHPADDTVTTHLDVLLKHVYWRRVDGAVLLAAAAVALVACAGYLT